MVKHLSQPPSPPPSFLPIRACVLSWLQMQWAAEEELYGEKIVSDLGHPLSLCLEQPPPRCPLCCARTQQQGTQQQGTQQQGTQQQGTQQQGTQQQGTQQQGGEERSVEAGRAALLPQQECAPAVFCVPCGEFFCHRCFHEFHITPRLQQHATHPVASSEISARAAAAAAGVAPHLPEDDVFVGDSAPVDAAVTVTNGENVTVTEGGSVAVTDVQVVLDYLASEAGATHRHELQRFRILSELLSDVQPQQLGHSERLAFWINVYNALAMHAYLVYGQPRSHYKRVMFMHKSAYIIAGLPFSILAIEHCILRAASFQPALAGLLPVQRYRRGDVRYSLALDRPEPLVTFALSCGCASAPPVSLPSLCPPSL
ncbi:unnamed protein product [Closterium sp. Yama58-4]|nr:unnamed protein product [Closterium sp. Yama58-4]